VYEERLSSLLCALFLVHQFLDGNVLLVANPESPFQELFHFWNVEPFHLSVSPLFELVASPGASAVSVLFAVLCSDAGEGGEGDGFGVGEYVLVSFEPDEHFSPPFVKPIVRFIKHFWIGDDLGPFPGAGGEWSWGIAQESGSFRREPLVGGPLVQTVVCLLGAFVGFRQFFKKMSLVVLHFFELCIEQCETSIGDAL
jgi:hypothetical protein